MQSILDLLRNDPALIEKLKSATSVDDAAKLLVDAAKQRGQNLKLSEVAHFLTHRPKSDPQALSDDELQAVSGGAIKTTLETKLTDCSKVCCYTCRTSSIYY